MRVNTRRSYQSAIRYFEAEWGGFLPATADSVARFLADQAETLSINTLRQRLAALAQWHIDQGFPIPPKHLWSQSISRYPGSTSSARETSEAPATGPIG